MGLVLRFGTGAEALAWGVMFVLLPLSGVFYPIDALPTVLQPIARLLPTTHAFAALRSLVDGTGTDWFQLAIAAVGSIMTLAPRAVVPRRDAARVPQARLHHPVHVISIRAPRPDELERLRDIERAAGQLFADAGLPDIAAHEPDSIESLTEYVDAGHAWAIADDDDVVGYAVVDILDGLAHLEQLSVHPDFGRRGLGAQLLEHVCGWASDEGFAAMTLTTFTPSRVERTVLRRARLSGAHRRRARSRASPSCGRKKRREGLDPALRVCMRRDL